MPDLGGLNNLGIPAWAIVTLLLWNYMLRPVLIKVLPQMFGWLREKEEYEYEQETARLDFERQDDVAIFTSMISLQTEIVRQNEKLLDYLMDRLDQRITTGFEHVKTELVSVRQELIKISDHWLDNIRELEKNREGTASFRHEIMSLIKRLKVIEKNVNTVIESQTTNQ